MCRLDRRCLAVPAAFLVAALALTLAAGSRASSTPNDTDQAPDVEAVAGDDGSAPPPVRTKLRFSASSIKEPVIQE